MEVNRAMEKTGLLSQVLDNINSKVVDVKSQISTLENKILSNGQDSTKSLLIVIKILSQINDILTLIQSTINQLNIVTEQVSTLNDKLDTFSDSFSQFQNNLNIDLFKQKSGYDSEIRFIKQTIDEIKSNVSELSQDIEQLSDEVQKMSHEISTLSEYMETNVKPLIKQNKEFKNILIVTLLGSGGVITVFIQKLLEFLIK